MSSTRRHVSFVSFCAGLVGSAPKNCERILVFCIRMFFARQSFQLAKVFSLISVSCSLVSGPTLTNCTTTGRVVAVQRHLTHGVLDLLSPTTKTRSPRDQRSRTAYYRVPVLLTDPSEWCAYEYSRSYTEPIQQRSRTISTLSFRDIDLQVKGVQRRKRYITDPSHLRYQQSQSADRFFDKKTTFHLFL